MYVVSRVGFLPLPSGNSIIEIEGGPFDGVAPHEFGVCLEAHSVKAGRADVLLPIPDFSTPRSVRDTTEALAKAVDALVGRKKVYVGCRGGFGRTGLFLAILAKVFGIDDPIAYVRRYYCPKAVETKEQERYVTDFPVQSLQRRLLFRRMQAKFPKLPL